MPWRATIIAGAVRPDDGCLEVDGRTVARVYIDRWGPQAGLWLWFFQGSPAATGRAPTKEAAKAECERLAAAMLAREQKGKDDGGKA